MYRMEKVRKFPNSIEITSNKKLIHHLKPFFTRYNTKKLEGNTRAILIMNMENYEIYEEVVSGMGHDTALILGD